MHCFKKLLISLCLLRARLWQNAFIRYLMVGAFGAGLAFAAIYIAVHYYHWPKPMAIFVMGSLGHAINFYLIKVVAYKDKNDSLKTIEVQIAEHVFLGIIFSAIAALVVVAGKSLSDHIPWLYFFVKIIVDLVSTVIVYRIEGKYVFFDKSPEGQNPI